MYDPTFWHWVLIFCVLFGIEIMAGTEFLLWLGLAAMASAVVKLAIPGISWQMQYALFALFCVAAVLAWRKFRKTETDIETDQPTLNQRNRKYVGRTLALSDAIEGGFGKIKVDDTTWKVTGDDAPVGTKVKIISAEGSLLHVEIV